MGTVVGWLPRLGWIAFGLTPLLLAVTGIVTWVIRRRLRRRKRDRGRGRDEGGEDPELESVAIGSEDD